MKIDFLLVHVFHFTKVSFKCKWKWNGGWSCQKGKFITIKRSHGLRMKTWKKIGGNPEAPIKPQKFSQNKAIKTRNCREYKKWFNLSIRKHGSLWDAATDSNSRRIKYSTRGKTIWWLHWIRARCSSQYQLNLGLNITALLLRPVTDALISLRWIQAGFSLLIMVINIESWIDSASERTCLNDGGWWFSVQSRTHDSCW